MNFTREPIIETIITPKDGYKLIVKNSGNAAAEEHSVDAVEVVSFGKSFFFRSMEKPKAFLLPVSDYEVVEVKETRVVLKKATVEKSIKIGGGKKEKPAEAPKKKTSRKKKSEPKQEAPKEDEPVEELQPVKDPEELKKLLAPPPSLITDHIERYKQFVKEPEASPLEPEEIEVAEFHVDDETPTDPALLVEETDQEVHIPEEENLPF